MNETTPGGKTPDVESVIDTYLSNAAGKLILLYEVTPFRGAPDEHPAMTEDEMHKYRELGAAKIDLADLKEVMRGWARLICVDKEKGDGSKTLKLNEFSRDTSRGKSSSNDPFVFYFYSLFYPSKQGPSDNLVQIRQAVIEEVKMCFNGDDNEMNGELGALKAIWKDADSYQREWLEGFSSEGSTVVQSTQE
eukprot:GHVU01081983.1.p1 GENE.GHVU01081983.1~~GHVU01081983.1.p1  ORF type:complete len:192 (-),score=25.09 GHVU01081983.1:1841-2416(-)